MHLISTYLVLTLFYKPVGTIISVRYYFNRQTYIFNPENMFEVSAYCILFYIVISIITTNFFNFLRGKQLRSLAQRRQPGLLLDICLVVTYILVS